MTSEQTIFQEKAKNYLVCFIETCPLHQQCLRWLAGCHAPVSPYSLLSVNPRNPEAGTENCPMYRDFQPVMLKFGMTRMYDDMPGRMERAIRRQLYQEFGRRYYFEMRKGERPITPGQQQVILDTCRHYGWQGPVVYDAEQEGLAW